MSLTGVCTYFLYYPSNRFPRVKNMKMLTLLFAIPWFNGLLSTRVSLTCSRSHAFQPYLSKCISGIQQKCAQLLTPFSDTAFYALSHGVICILPSVSPRKTLSGWSKLSNSQLESSIPVVLKLCTESGVIRVKLQRLDTGYSLIFQYALQVVTKKLAALIQSFSFILIFMSFDFFHAKIAWVVRALASKD